MTLDEYMTKNTRPLKENEWIKFKCSGCGTCCRHVKESIPIESLDAYRLARHFQTQGKTLEYMDDVLYQYADPVPLDECGYFIYMLKTTEPDDTCIFLKDNRCTIHPVKPRACRTYPLCAEPVKTGFHYHLCTEQAHHFQEKQIKVKTFMNHYFTQEDQEFVNLDFRSAIPIANLMRRIPKSRMKEALLLFLRYKYSDFDLDKPFQEQYEKNIETLLASLKALISQKEGTYYETNN